MRPESSPTTTTGTGTPTTDSSSSGALEQIAHQVAAKAAQLIRGRLGQNHVVETKSTPTDVVTAVDVEVEAFIRAELLKATPEAAICGEEQAHLTGKTAIGWIVDPIDGTVNFLYDLPVISVSIAGTIDGEVVAGAVADVVRGEIFSGSAGNGVRRDGVRVTPSDTSKLDDALVGTGFSYAAEGREREAAVIARVLPAARDIRCFGSAALHLCWVACGRLEAFYQRGLQQWDVAAGAFLAAEAGARVEQETGSSDGLVLAATQAVFKPLHALVRE